MLQDLQVQSHRPQGLSNVLILLATPSTLGLCFLLPYYKVFWGAQDGSCEDVLLSSALRAAIFICRGPHMMPLLVLSGFMFR